MEKYVIGVDGGGTKTEVMLSDTNKRILDSFTIGSINYNGGSPSLIHANVEAIFQKIRERGYSREDCLAICIGAAGISNGTVKDKILSVIHEAGYQCQVFITGDVDTAFAGALAGQHGIILISGTGSICYGQDEQENAFRSGGYGHLIDDGGSGYAIARDMLAGIVQAHDGRIGPTVIKELVFGFLGIKTVEELISYVYSPDRSKKDIAQLSQLIQKAYEQRDSLGIRIIEKCAEDLILLVNAVACRIEGEIPLAVSGSILLKNEVIFQKFKEKIEEQHPRLSIKKPLHNAAYGAVLLALEKGGL